MICWDLKENTREREHSKVRLKDESFKLKETNNDNLTISKFRQKREIKEAFDSTTAVRGVKLKNKCYLTI